MHTAVVDEWDFLPMVVLCVVYHLLATWTYGLSVSSGVFIPLLFIGSLWGRVVGMLVMAVWPAAVSVDHLLLYCQWHSYRGGFSDLTNSDIRPLVARVFEVQKLHKEKWAHRTKLYERKRTISWDCC